MFDRNHEDQSYAVEKDEDAQATTRVILLPPDIENISSVLEDNKMFMQTGEISLLNQIISPKMVNDKSR